MNTKPSQSTNPPGEPFPWKTSYPKMSPYEFPWAEWPYDKGPCDPLGPNDPPCPNDPYIPPGMAIVGTCSLCGGPVCVHSPWLSTVPDTPTCVRCGAVKDDTPNYGPVIPMRKGPYVRRDGTTTDDYKHYPPTLPQCNDYTGPWKEENGKNTSGVIFMTAIKVL